MKSPTDLIRASPAAPSQVKRTAATCWKPLGRKVVNVVPQSAEEGFALRGQLDLAAPTSAAVVTRPRDSSWVMVPATVAGSSSNRTAACWMNASRVLPGPTAASMFRRPGDRQRRNSRVSGGPTAAPGWKASGTPQAWG